MKKRTPAEIKKDNKAFEEASKAEKRVLVAKDVLLQIKKGRIAAATGLYLRAEDTCPVKIGDSLQKVFNKRNGPECTVCGIGAAFYSTVRKFNQYKVVEDDIDVEEYEQADKRPLKGDLNEIGDYNMRPLLRKIFPTKQLTMIECAFEVTTCHTDSYRAKPSNLEELKAKSVQFGGRYEERMNA